MSELNFPQKFVCRSNATFKKSEPFNATFLYELVESSQVIQLSLKEKKTFDTFFSVSKINLQLPSIDGIILTCSQHYNQPTRRHP